MFLYLVSCGLFHGNDKLLVKVKSNLGVLNDDFYGLKIFSFLSYEKHTLVKIYSNVNLMLFYYFRRGSGCSHYKH